MSAILGISAYYHDSAAALVRDGAIVAAAQEERFTRKRHDARFPAEAIRYCLREGGIALSDLELVVFYDKPLAKFDRLLQTYLAYAPRGARQFVAAMPVWIREKLYLKSVLRRELRELGAEVEKVEFANAAEVGVKVEKVECANTAGSAKVEKVENAKRAEPKLLFTEHHQAHAASAFYPSPFASAAVLCLDGVGEWATTTLWHGRGSALEPKWEIDFPHSLGLLYSAFTGYAGFRVNSGEYKLMGLAPYGEPRFAKLIRDELIDIKPDGTYRLNLDYFGYPTQLRMTTPKFERLFGGPARRPEGKLEPRHMDLARSIQEVTEEVVLRLARTAHAETGEKQLCLAGGVALNCVANGRVLREGPFERIWIQPAAGDAGGALGAALCGWHEYLGRERTVPAVAAPEVAEQSEAYTKDGMRGAYLGPAFDTAEIRARLDRLGARYLALTESELLARAARALEDGAVLGWFQGRMEFGPRALGARSILGDARNAKMQSVMNLKIKLRESFRPFAPAVLAERAEELFDLRGASPYMLVTAPVRESARLPVAPGEAKLFGIDRLSVARSKIPAVTHVDYSARVQTVHRETNPRFHRLLEVFAQNTGCPVLVNTSFNVRGEPIVHSPEDAYRCFLRTEMDALAIGDLYLTKTEQPAQAIAEARAAAAKFEPD